MQKTFHQRREDRRVSREKRKIIKEIREGAKKVFGHLDLEDDATPLDVMKAIMRMPISTDNYDLRVSQLKIVFEAAKAAAPYVHPRLANIEGGSKDDMSHEEALRDLG